MQRMWRRMIAAAAGVLAVVGMASAQSPPPSPLPTAPVVPVAGAVHAKGSGGCTNCGPAAGPAVPFAQYGPGQRNGCGSARHHAGFIFGSCKSFFDPCGPLPCEGFGRFKNPCPVHTPAAPYGTGYNGCVYDSYLQH